MYKQYIATSCTLNALGTLDGMEELSAEMSISDARANMSEVVSVVRLQRRAFLLMRRDKPQAVIVPAEFWEAIERAGGPDELLKLIENHLPTK